MNGSWDVWWYRENIGWWLEDQGLATSKIGASVRRLMEAHPDDDFTKFAFMVVPTGTQPINFAPKYNH